MATNNRVLEGFLRDVAPELRGSAGHWTFELEQVELVILTDEGHDRMRIMTPIVEVEPLSPTKLLTLLEANFDRALDARYAVWRGSVWGAYVHPLSPLTKAELESAVRQVIALKKNYGTTYASSDLVFGGGGGSERN